MKNEELATHQRTFSPNHSQLAKEMLGLDIEKRKLIAKVVSDYNAKFKELKLKCVENGHKYDDGVLALVESRYNYNDYRDECQICGTVIRN